MPTKQENLSHIQQTLHAGRAVVMGILNATPDSFYAGSRCGTPEEIARRADTILAEGGQIIDIGACSTRPGSTPATEAEERQRLQRALDIVCARHPAAVLSVDTFRPRIAEMCLADYGVRIINDVSGGSDEMFAVIAAGSSATEGEVVYILTSTMPLAATEHFFETTLAQLRAHGCGAVWLDPGYGFGKDLAENYHVLAHQAALLRFGCPLLAGISRKRMAWQPLAITPDMAGNATTVLNTLCIAHGATILRVHDVLQAREAITIVETMKNNEICSSPSA